MAAAVFGFPQQEGLLPVFQRKRRDTHPTHAQNVDPPSRT